VGVSANLVGVASSERFVGDSEGHRPWDLLPNARASWFLVWRCRGVETIPKNILPFIEQRGFKVLPLSPDEPKIW